MISSSIFWLLHIDMKHPESIFERIKILYNFSKVCWSAPQSLWAITWRSVNVLLHFSFKYWMCGMKESLLSKIMPRNLYWSMTGISDLSRFNVGLLCIFLNWQKCTHWLFVLEILKSFIIAHLFILLIPCYSWHSAVCIYLDVEVMQKSSMNKYFSTPGFRQLVMQLIFMLKRVTDSILPWRTPSSWFWMFDRVEYGLGISCTKEKLW